VAVDVALVIVVVVVGHEDVKVLEFGGGLPGDPGAAGDAGEDGD